MGRVHTFRGKTRKKTIVFSEIIRENSLAETLIQSIYQFLNRSERDSLHQRDRWVSDSQDIMLEL